MVGVMIFQGAAGHQLATVTTGALNAFVRNDVFQDGHVLALRVPRSCFRVTDEYVLLTHGKTPWALSVPLLFGDPVQHTHLLAPLSGQALS